MKRAWWILVAALALPSPARAEADRDRFGAGGYFRVMTRPDAQGGDGKLGYWNLYGRLMNEGPYAALELKLDLLQQQPRSVAPWTSLHAKIEGGSVANADPRRGSLDQFRLSQLYVQAGNVGLRDVTWQLGTLDYYFGDLGLYDLKPAELFFDTVGLSGTWRSRNVDVIVGAGDAGYFVRGPQYDTIFTTGAAMRVRLGGHFEIGGGAQTQYEPKVQGNRFAPYATAGVKYSDFVRHEVVEQYLLANPGQDFDQNHRPDPRSSFSWKTVGYVGFGKLGPLQWNNLFFNVQKRHPDNFYTESYLGKTYTIYTRDLTDERFEINVGNEMHLTIVPERLDAAWGVVYGDYTDADNSVAPADAARTFYSTVGRLQLYVTPTVHLLGESSIAREISRNGNAYRDHVDSIFQNDAGVPNSRGLEYGDDRQRDTWQGKFGVVLNPAGYGLFNRPSLRLLYGLQYSTQNEAFGNSFVTSLDQYNYFGAKEQHWHQMIGFEAEAWF